MRLIDADALKADLQKFFPEECLDGITSRTLFAQILTDISNAPTSEYPCVIKVKTEVDAQRVSDELRRQAKIGVILPVEDIEVKRLQRPQGDLISREALKKELQAQHDFYINSWKENGVAPIDIPIPDKSRIDEIDTAIAMVINAPTVEPDMDFAKECYANGYEDGKNERPQGEWKMNLTTGDIFCSCCKEVRRDTRTKHINFCNSCGADMRKGDTE